MTFLEFVAVCRVKLRLWKQINSPFDYSPRFNCGQRCFDWFWANSMCVSNNWFNLAFCFRIRTLRKEVIQKSQFKFDFFLTESCWFILGLEFLFKFCIKNRMSLGRMTFWIVYLSTPSLSIFPFKRGLRINS